MAVERKWKKGDDVQILLPMHNSVEQMPNVPSYIAIMHGPILLGARTGTGDLKGLVADDGRWGQIAGGERLPVEKAPIIIAYGPDDIADKITPVKDKPLRFTASSLNIVNKGNIELEPFYGIHDSRYMIYWMWLTESSTKITSIR